MPKSRVGNTNGVWDKCNVGGLYQKIVGKLMFTAAERPNIQQKLRDMHSEPVHAKELFIYAVATELGADLKLAPHSDSTATISQHTKKCLGRKNTSSFVSCLRKMS